MWPLPDDADTLPPDGAQWHRPDLECRHCDVQWSSAAGACCWLCGRGGHHAVATGIYGMSIRYSGRAH